MNLTHLHELCKKYGNECYEYAFYTYYNSPFKKPPCIEGIINTQVNQVFGGKVLDKFTRDFNPTLAQWKIADKVVSNYRKKIIEHLYIKINGK